MKDRFYFNAKMMFGFIIRKVGAREGMNEP